MTSNWTTEKRMTNATGRVDFQATRNFVSQKAISRGKTNVSEIFPTNTACRLYTSVCIRCKEITQSQLPTPPPGLSAALVSAKLGTIPALLQPAILSSPPSWSSRLRSRRRFLVTGKRGLAEIVLEATSLKVQVKRCTQVIYQVYRNS